MTKNKCEKFKLSEDGFCENYIGNKEHINSDHFGDV